MRNSRADLFYLQGLPVDRNCITTRSHVRAFLLLTSILNGFLVGVLTTTTKLFTETIKSCDGVVAVFTNPFVYLFWGLMCVSMLSNVYNLNVTMRNYS